MARKKYMYLLERIKDSHDWPAGCRIWAERPCTGWRVVGRMEVRGRKCTTFGKRTTLIIPKKCRRYSTI